MVMILNTDNQLNAANLCDRLVWSRINYSFEVVGYQFTVSVAECDVKRVLDNTDGLGE